MAKILVIGSINMDLVVRVPHAPAPGETVLGGDFTTFPGGKGANQAVAAARMGGEVTMVGRVGNDDFGNTLIHGLLENKVKPTRVTKDASAPSGIAMIAVAADGENMIVVASGANMNVSVEDINKARELMREADLVLLQLETPVKVLSAAVEMAKTYDVTVVLNPAPAQHLAESLLAKIDVITPNENELAVLSGEANMEDGIQRLRDWGVKNMVITLGANGARVVTEEIDQHLPAYDVTAVDTTAAGDAFNGALAVALAEGKTLLDAVKDGMAAGALAATKHGAQPSLPTRDMVIEFLAANAG